MLIDFLNLKLKQKLAYCFVLKHMIFFLDPVLWEQVVPLKCCLSHYSISIMHAQIVNHPKSLALSWSDFNQTIKMPHDHSLKRREETQTPWPDTFNLELAAGNKFSNSALEFARKEDSLHLLSFCTQLLFLSFSFFFYFRFVIMSLNASFRLRFFFLFFRSAFFNEFFCL